MDSEKPKKFHSLDDYRKSRLAAPEPEFLKVLTTEDDLGAVLRAHLFVEYWLRWTLTSSKIECGPNLQYMELLNRCIGRRLIEPDLEDSLRMLNMLRNKFAHNVDYELTPAIVRRFADTLQGLAKEIYDETEVEWPKDSPMPERHQFRDMLCAVAGCIGPL